MTSARSLKPEWVSIRVHVSPVSALSVGLGYGSKLCALQAAGLCFVGSPRGLPQQSVPGLGEQDPCSGSPQQKGQEKETKIMLFCDLKHPLAGIGSIVWPQTRVSC